MNNYFGIGLDAKISLEFNNKRDEHPKKCRLAVTPPPGKKTLGVTAGMLEGTAGMPEGEHQDAGRGHGDARRGWWVKGGAGGSGGSLVDPLSPPAAPRSSRTKNMMWYGVLGTKELLQRTYKNLEQRVQLEVGGPGMAWGGHRGCRGAPPHRLSPLLAVRRGAHLAAQPAGHRRAQHPQLRRGHQFLGRHQGGQRECEARGAGGCWGVGGGKAEPSLVVPPPRRTSGPPRSMTRSWRWWPFLEASRWPCHGSSTCSTTASPR